MAKRVPQNWVTDYRHISKLVQGVPLALNLVNVQHANGLVKCGGASILFSKIRNAFVPCPAQPTAQSFATAR